MRGRSRSGCTTRIVFALLILSFAVAKYYMSTHEEVNPYTGEKQRISLSPEQEIALGLQAEAQMEQQYGGLHPSAEARAKVDEVGGRLVRSTIAARSPYRFKFHLLRDEETINAFALPGGQIFITAALFKLLRNEDELAGVLGHEIGHVLARHSAEQMASQGLFAGIGMAVGTAISDDAGANQRVAGMVNHVISTKYGRGDEFHSDEIGAKLMLDSGYDPRAMIGVMEILRDAAGSGGQPEILSTHPFPENRIERLKREVLPALGVEVTE
ncbi:MAG: M48 family metalloprotease [Akkermansiaceae bacterium]|nr:M48 family metalloprotease [Akkermansiaceae bacterium]MCP5551709.1 M48 family metalloprotease [Akkermansiaceae bacterium]